MPSQFILATVIAALSLFDLSAPQQIVKLFEARYRAAHTMQAAFLERYTENGRISRVEAGEAYFRRPGRMRWEYNSPEKNLFLVDGKTAWFYVPSDHTVTRVPAKNSSDWRTPLALLAGEMKVSRVCARVEIAKDEQAKSVADALLSCELRGDTAPANSSKEHSATAAVQRPEVVFLEIVKSSGELVRVLVRDPGGVEIEFQFANWRMNPPLPEAFFHFELPEKTAIVNGDATAASGFTR